MAEKTITILSIDGGGVRGIIPGVLLDFLENELQILENDPNVRVVDYFDVISGTSTGGLISAMISTPNDQGCPLYAAHEIVPFYKEHCPNIFPRSTEDDDETSVIEDKVLKSPAYDGKYLHELARKLLGEKRLHDTLTKVVIPAYDVKKLSPVVFSSYEVDNGNKVLDALLSDICISTSAAPTFLPSYKFINEGVEFNMIDGGVAANNPAVAAITEAIKKRSEEIDEGAKIDLNSFRVVVLSLGTCEDKTAQKYDTDLVNSFLAINWLIYPLKTFWKADHPIVEILFDANSDMIDYYCTMFFDSFQNSENFLRIQDDKLPKELVAMDNGTPKNLDKLEQYAKDLLNKPVSRLNPATFERIEIDTSETYAKALEKFAKKLYDIKHGVCIYVQILENDPNVRVADYCDVTSGTSTGGLIPMMISAPNDQGRPLYAAYELVPFYKENCPKIFPRSIESESEKALAKEDDGKTSITKDEAVGKPYYDGQYLHRLARDILGEKRLHDTLTKVVIPIYDIKKSSPVIFDSYEVVFCQT